MFRIFKMVARRSKYDFWIPDKILSWSIYFLKKTYFAPKATQLPYIEAKLTEGQVYVTRHQMSPKFGKCC